MSILTNIATNVKAIFSKASLRALAKETAFIQRERQITAQDFLFHHLDLTLGGQCSLSDVVDAFDEQHITVSRQAVNRKYTTQACDFLKKLLDQLLDVTMEKHLCLTAIPFVNAIKTVDSSYLKLNKCLSSVHPGLRHQGAGVKLQTIMDIASHQLHSLDIRQACENDQSYQQYTEYLEENDLSINDLGYFCVDSFRKINDKGAFFLSRLLKKTTVYHAEDEQPIDLEKTLKQSRGDKIALSIRLGKTALPCRLIAMRLPPEAYEQRLKNVTKKNRKDGRQKKTKPSSLEQWTLLVTNLSDTVTPETLVTLYRLRWQIELFFKIVKTFFKARTINDVNPHKAFVSIYISLIATTLLTQQAMTLVEQEISLYKAARLFVKHIKRVVLTLSSAGCFSWLIEKIKRHALKTMTPKRPSTKRSLGVIYA